MTWIADDRRLWLACGVAALIHLLVLFALRIGVEPAAPVALEITLLGASGRETPLTTRVLAPVAQSGGGMRRELRGTLPQAGDSRTFDGLRHADEFEMRSAQTPQQPPAVVTGEAPSLQSITRGTQESSTGHDASSRLLRQQSAGSNTPTADSTSGDHRASDDNLRIAEGVSARASREAAYRERWRQKVEQTGSRNFPWSALTLGKPRSLTLLVSVRADGSIAQTRVLRSSGLPMLDQAALDILRMAAPFPVFPEALRRDRTELSFAYDWEFLPGDRAALRMRP